MKGKKNRPAQKTKVIAADSFLEVTIPRNFPGHTPPPASTTAPAHIKADITTSARKKRRPPSQITPQPAAVFDSPQPPSEKVPFAAIRKYASLHRQQILLGLSTFFLTFIFMNGIFYATRHLPVDKLIATPRLQVTPTPEPVVDKSIWIFEVLNGSGKTGEAAKAAETLTTLGYMVIKVGNATPSAQTQLFISEATLAEADLLLNDLKEEFAVASLSGMLLADEDSTATARLVIGKTSND